MSDPLVGCLLGTAVGDALGLPYENLSPRRAARLLGPPTRYRFVFARGMVSDDTEHACMVAQALITSQGKPEAFARDLARRLRWWLLALPAGIGFATLRAILKLWLGWPPARSGVFSAGNGPAMRAPILGAAVADRARLVDLVRASTRLTHTDPKAEYGALAVALAARCAVEQRPPQEYAGELRDLLPEAAGAFLKRLDAVLASVARGETTPAFAAAQGMSRGVSGYIYHSVPVALHAWLSHPRDYAEAVQSVILAGGDTDTTAAIVGGIVGAAVGKAGIPAAWLTHLAEWPRTVAWMERLAESLGHGEKPPPRLSGLATLARNGWFLLVVLTHVARRCLPPY